MTIIILREAMGLDNPFRAVLRILPDRPGPTIHTACSYLSASSLLAFGMMG